MDQGMLVLTGSRATTPVPFHEFTRCQVMMRADKALTRDMKSFRFTERKTEPATDAIFGPTNRWLTGKGFVSRSLIHWRDGPNLLKGRALDL